MKIICKIINGVPKNITYSQKDVDGFESIELDKNIRKIEDVDWESVKTEEAKNREALEEQTRTCERLLNESDKKVLPDWPYQDDIPSWKEYRTELRPIISSGIIQEIPEKPFG
jgi:hypothetical protein